MKKIGIQLCLFLCWTMSICAQEQVAGELKEYNDYVLGLGCYRSASALGMQISGKFMEGDISAVRKLSAEREKLLMQAIDSVFVFRPEASGNEAAARMVCRLAFNLGYENAVRVAERFDRELECEPLKEMRSNLAKESKVRPGMSAPAFRLMDKEGKEYTSESFQDKYIFLEFSASWCSWCKKEIPSIREAYEQYQDRVAFITVHLDDNREKWLKDLEEHAVPWYCLTDLKAWKSPVAEAYHVSGVPDCYIIGPDRIIKARGVRGKEIGDKLKELLDGGEGILFYPGTFREAQQKAKDAGKLIFMDCYTSWCAPCKMMNTTVFTDVKVGQFFNEHFINVKFDMEKGEGRELLKRYGMQVFPTYLLLDAEGNELHRVVGGHDPEEFIRLMREGMDAEHSIAGMQKRFEAGERQADFLRRYIEVLGGGYRFDKIPAVLDVLCRMNGENISRKDWLLIRRYLSDPSSYAFRYVAAHKKQIQQYIDAGELEAWMEKVLYVPVFNAVNSTVFGENEYDPLRFAALRKDIQDIRPRRTVYLLSILDFYDAFRMGKMDKVLKIYKKQFMTLPSSDRFGLTMQLNAMLYAKGNSRQCQEGLAIFRRLFHPDDPILHNFEKSLKEKIG